MEDIIPDVKEEHAAELKPLVSIASDVVSKISTGDFIRFLNTNIPLIFEADPKPFGIEQIVLDYIQDYQNGIQDGAFRWLCEHRGYLLLDRFEDFIKTFEKCPEAFDSIFSTGNYEEIDSLRFPTVLNVFAYISGKTNSPLQSTVDRIVPILYGEMIRLADAITVDNAIQSEQKIRQFAEFLGRIKSPLAIEFYPYLKKTEQVLKESVEKHGHSYTFEIPIQEILNQWKTTEPWTLRIMSLTHSPKLIDEVPAVRSQLDFAPGPKDALLDMVSSNVPSDDYFTFSHQQMLNVHAATGSATIIGILRDESLLSDYLGMITSEISFIVQQLGPYDDCLNEDAKFLTSGLQLIIANHDKEGGVLHPLCYSVSMFLCAFIEKILR